MLLKDFVAFCEILGEIFAIKRAFTHSLICKQTNFMPNICYEILLIIAQNQSISQI